MRRGGGGGVLFPRGHVASSGNIFDGHDGRRSPWHRAPQAQDGPTTENPLAPNVHSAGAGSDDVRGRHRTEVVFPLTFTLLQSLIQRSLGPDSTTL